MVENLNVTTYQNGDPIPQVQDKTKWMQLKTGAWCYYENKTENGKIYGKLYNWFAITDPRGLAPKDWHIPTELEWTNLVMEVTSDEKNSYLSGERLKSVNGWKQNGNGTDRNGFSAQPAGFHCGSYGPFLQLGEKGHWWCIDDKVFVIEYNSKTAGFSGFRSKADGFSIRCIKDLKTD